MSEPLTPEERVKVMCQWLRGKDYIRHRDTLDFILSVLEKDGEQNLAPKWIEDWRLVEKHKDDFQEYDNGTN